MIRLAQVWTNWVTLSSALSGHCALSGRTMWTDTCGGEPNFWKPGWEHFWVGAKISSNSCGGGDLTLDDTMRRILQTRPFEVYLFKNREKALSLILLLQASSSYVVSSGIKSCWLIWFERIPIYFRQHKKARVLAKKRKWAVYCL